MMAAPASSVHASNATYFLHVLLRQRPACGNAQLDALNGLDPREVVRDVALRAGVAMGKFVQDLLGV